MFNDPLDVGQCRHLIAQLSSTLFPFQCAHGRSVYPYSSSYEEPYPYQSLAPRWYLSRASQRLTWSITASGNSIGADSCPRAYKPDVSVRSYYCWKCPRASILLPFNIQQHDVLSDCVNMYNYTIMITLQPPDSLRVPIGLPNEAYDLKHYDNRST